MDSSELRMNLAALQRIDPYIKTIVDSSSQVALYRYEDEEWKRTNTEGTLFVYERKCQPLHGFLILNRMSPENWVQPITDGIENQIQPPFILYKTKDSDIYGIWFYEEEKCRKIGGTLTKFVAQSEEQRQQQASAGGARKMDLSSLLNKANNKASKELDKPNPRSGDINLRTTKDSPSSGGEKLLRMLASAGTTSAASADANVKNGGGGGGEDRNGPPQQPLTTAPSASSVLEFFAQASQQQQGNNGAGQTGPPPNLMGSPRPPVAAAPGLPTNGPPQANSHPIVGPSVVGPGIIPIMHGVPPGMTLLPQHPGAPPVLVPIIRPGVTSSPGHAGEVGLSARPSGFQPMMNSTQQIHEPPNAMHSLMCNPGTVSVEALERTQREESCTPPHQSSSSKTSSSKQATTNLESDLKSKLNILGGGGGKRTSPSVKHRSPTLEGVGGEPELLSPMAFSSTSSSAQRIVVQPPVTTKEQYNGSTSNPGNRSEVTPLTQGQMVQAMQHLLRTDKTFVAKLHQAYVESLNNKLN